MPPVTASTRPAVDTPMPSNRSARAGLLLASTVRHIAHGDEHRAAPTLRLRAFRFRTSLQGSVDLLVSQQRAGDLRAADIKRRNVADIPCTPPFRKAPYHLVSTMVPQTKKPARVELRRLAVKSEEKLLADGMSASMRPAFLMTSTMAATSSPSSGWTARASGSC